MHQSCPCFAPAPFGRMRHEPRERRARHCHRHKFAAVVLAGGYLEAGDAGRRTVGPGEVILHGAFESHLDRFGARGAEVLILPLQTDNDAAPFGRVADADALARLAERDAGAAALALGQALQPIDSAPSDWPDLLARELRTRPDLELTRWADELGIRPESISRGFQLAFGTTPRAFRATAKARTAFGLLTSTGDPLAAVAFDAGFADQAHMTRAIVRLTGRPPGWWRRAA